MRNCYYHMPCPDPLAKIHFASHYRSFQYSNITTPSSPTQFPSSSFPPKSHHPSISCWGTRYLDGQWFGWVHQRLLTAPALWKLSSLPKHGSKATADGWEHLIQLENSIIFKFELLVKFKSTKLYPQGLFSESKKYMNPKHLVHFVLVGSTPRVLWVYIYDIYLFIYKRFQYPTLHKKSWIHHIQVTVRKESLPTLKNNTRRSQQVDASGANLGLVPRAKMAGCWIRTSAVNSRLHQVVGWWFVGNQYGICIYVPSVLDSLFYLFVIET